jgi:aryl-alcohol dehydrogenase-like predicted oxidoreductase
MSDLERRQLGSTGLSVTVLGFGAMDLGGAPAAAAISDDEAGLVLNAALDAGINFIDTAVCYGSSEARIGQAIAHRRGEYVLATKCGCMPGQGMGVPHTYSAANIRAGVEHSLRTMRTDHIDIAQFHGSLAPAEWQAEGALDELQKLKAEGKLRIPRHRGRGFHGMMGTISTRWWARIPRHRGRPW